MINFIHEYPNKYEKDFNEDFLLHKQDDSLEDFAIMAMMEFNSVKNIKILDYEIIADQDLVDYNRHNINVNYKKANITEMEIPKFKYITDSRFREIVFHIQVKTNLNERIIEKRILIPVMYDGFYWNMGKKMRAIWQMVDASTYSQRGKITEKAKMPIVIYHNKSRKAEDVNKEVYSLPSYSYALETKSKRPGSKRRTKFMNPLIIYSAKMGYSKTLEFFGMKGIVELVSDYDEKEQGKFLFFPLDQYYLKVKKTLFETYPLIQSFVCMSADLHHKDFPVCKATLDDTLYWTCRMGADGSIKSKDISSYLDKGKTTQFMIERLLDQKTIKNLRLPDCYRNSIYQVLYWMITNFKDLKSRDNIDMKNKRIRCNEYIVDSSLGKKIGENLNKLVEKLSKSKLNTMDTLLEIFNFNSDIIMAGMRNLGDLVKTDDLVNDLTFLADISFSTKGPNSIGEMNSNKVSAKFRYLHPSMVGVQDLSSSSNSDPGRSGSFTPFVELYDGFYFSPDHEPCLARYEFEKALSEDPEFKRKRKLPLDTPEDYLAYLTEKHPFRKDLEYETIEIVEKEDSMIRRKID